jgi:hypothetical protein
MEWLVVLCNQAGERFPAILPFILVSPALVTLIPEDSILKLKFRSSGPLVGQV